MLWTIYVYNIIYNSSIQKIEGFKMSAYNYQRVSNQFEQKLNFNRSEQLALNNGFKVVLDEGAYNGRYFIKDGKKWIHNISALKKQFAITDNSKLVQLGYDVDTYFETH